MDTVTVAVIKRMHVESRLDSQNQDPPHIQRQRLTSLAISRIFAVYTLCTNVVGGEQSVPDKVQAYLRESGPTVVRSKKAIIFALCN